MDEPEPEIVCVDCGGRAHLITQPRPEGEPWLPGDIVAYRCADCWDRWDIVLPVEEGLEDLDPEYDG